MSYTVLARRYRSESFDQVVGQEAIAQTLKNAITSDRVAHAYIFSGTRGVGKTTMARVLSKALNCLESDGPTITPCCKCDSCVAISQGEDIDVIEIDGASNTGVEHIRELRQNAIYHPARARFKIYIIDEVHMLSTSAFNALLKTLEEPPGHVKFIFATTEPNKIPATIHSRCQRFDFRNISIDDIAGQLKNVLEGEGVESDEAVVRRVARLARGSMRDGLSLLDQLLSMSGGKLSAELMTELLGTPRLERILKIAASIADSSIAGALQEIDAGISEGLALEQIAGALQEHFRDLMVIRACGADTELVELDDGETRQQAAEQAKCFDEATLVYFITVLEELRRSLKSTGAGRPLLEAAIVRLTATERFSDTKAIIKHLENMPKGGAALPQTRPTQGPVGNASPRSMPAPPTQVAAAASASGASPLTELPATITLEWLKDNWLRILNKVPGHLAGYIRPALVQNWGSGRLTLKFPPSGSGMFKALQSRGLSDIQKAFCEVLNQPVALDVSVEEAGHNQAHPAPPGARPSQAEINDAVNDPKVQEIQKILGGKVCQVERGKKKSD